MNSSRKNKYHLPDIIFSKFFLIISVFIFLAVLFCLAKGIIRSHQVNAEILNLQKEVTQQEQQKGDFSHLLSYLKSDDFIEQEAKLKLGYKNPGENMVVIPQAQGQSQQENTADLQNLSNPAKWWKYFFNN